MIRRALLVFAGGATALPLAIVTGAAETPLGPAPALCAAATFQHRVALVVEHGDGRFLRACVGFDGPSISGAEILQASGVEAGTTSYGSLGEAVCQIDYEPASYPPGCWTSTSWYWASFVSRQGGAWATASSGVSSESFSDGDAEGFRYEPQSGSVTVPVSAAGTCAAASTTAAGKAATPAPAPSPAATEGSRATATARASPSPVAPSPSGTATATAGLIGAAPAAAHPPPPAQLSPALLAVVVIAGCLAGLLFVRAATSRSK